MRFNAGCNADLHVEDSHSLGVGRTVSTVGLGKGMVVIKGIVVSGGGGKVGAGVILEPTTVEEVEKSVRS